MSSLYSEVFSVKYKSFQEWKIQNQDVVFTRNYCRKELLPRLLNRYVKSLYMDSQYYTPYPWSSKHLIVIVATIDFSCKCQYHTEY
jgi:hypothetical protein